MLWPYTMYRLGQLDLLSNAQMVVFQFLKMNLRMVGQPVKNTHEAKKGEHFKWPGIRVISSDPESGSFQMTIWLEVCYILIIVGK